VLSFIKYLFSPIHRLLRYLHLDQEGAQDKAREPEQERGGIMGFLLSSVFMVSRILSGIAAVALAAMMCLTVADVIGRGFGYPILGTYEVVSMTCIIAIGFAIPLTSFKRRHVYMEFVIERLGRKARNTMNTGTRALCLILFVLAGTNLFHMAAEFASIDVPHERERSANPRTEQERSRQKKRHVQTQLRPVQRGH